MEFQLLVFLALYINCAIAAKKNPEVELLSHLIDDQNPDALPRTSVDKPVVLRFGMAVRQILEMNEKEQVLTTSVWIRHYWNNQFLKWNVSEWDNVNFLSVSPDSIWKPDISLYNNAAADFQGFDNYGQTKINVYPDGECVWLIPAILKSECRLMMDFYPFDRQVCPFTFGSWAYDGAALDFQKNVDDVDMTSFSKSGAFKVRGGNVTRESTLFSCCPNPYIKLKFEIVLDRRVQFYLFNLLIPGIIIALLSCFTFLLPAGSGERTGLAITNLLAMSVYVLMISDKIPPSPDAVPLLVQFFTCMIAEIAIALVINCIIIPIAIWNTPMPHILKKIFFKYLGPFVFVNTSCPPCRTILVEEDTELLLKKQQDEKEDMEFQNKEGNNEFEKSVVNNLKKIAKIMEDNEESSANNDDWELLIRIADRLFFFGFIIIILVSCFALVLPNSGMDNV